ncbi:MAG: hypothetical protein AMXMBFR36_05790 [Acidobacteriota bacterium]
MTNPGRAEDARIASRLAAALPGLVAVYRFGSTAAGTERAGSDVDLAVLAEGPVDAGRRFDLQEELATELGRDVDLVDLGRASTVLAVEVVGRGELLLDADPARRGAFEDLALSSYARLNEERRAILERVAAEGTVHGR